MKKEKTSEKGKAWLKREMRPYRASIAFITLLSVLTTLASLAFAYAVRFLVDGAQNSSRRQILTVAAVLLGFLALKITSHVYYAYKSEKLRAKITAQQRTRIFGKLLRSNYSSVSEHHSGDLLNRITSDVSEVVVDTVGLLPTLTGMAVQCVGAITALCYLDPLFTGIYALCGVLGGAIMALFRNKVKRLHKDFMRIDGDSRAFIQEGISSLLTVKAYNAEKRAIRKAEGYSQSYYTARMKRNYLRTFMNLLSNLLSNVGLIFAVVWCSIRLMHGMEFGVMLSIVLLINQLQHPFSAVSGVIPVIYSRRASAERLEEITSIDECCALPETTARPFEGVVLSNVSFSYGREDVLKSATMSVSKGETICLIGSSGSGKSTLFKLLLGVYAPTDGEISLVSDGGKASYDPCNLYAYVPQGNFLLSGTIRENLLFFAEEGEDEEKILEALRTAQAEFVLSLPEGLDTYLSERGAGLSEGQQQRLAIARALLSNRPVLLLDESTSALDGETEGRLLQAIKGLEEKTCILVTHRPAALSVADRIYELADGTISLK